MGHSPEVTRKEDDAAARQKTSVGYLQVMMGHPPPQKTRTTLKKKKKKLHVKLASVDALFPLFFNQMIFPMSYVCPA